MNWYRRFFGGMLFWTNLVFECMHLQSQNVVGQARLIVGGNNVLRVDGEPVHPKIELSDWKRSCDMLPVIGEKLFERHGEQVAQDFLQNHAVAYAPQYTPSSQP